MINEVIKTLRSLDAHIIGTILDENRTLRLPFSLRRGSGTATMPEVLSDDDVQMANNAEPVKVKIS